jgi:hypothetical protein
MSLPARDGSEVRRKTDGLAAAAAARPRDAAERARAEYWKKYDWLGGSGDVREVLSASGVAPAWSPKKRQPQYASLRSICVFEDSEVGVAGAASTPNAARKPFKALSVLTNTPKTPGKTPGKRPAVSHAMEVNFCAACVRTRAELQSCLAGVTGGDWGQGKSFGADVAAAQAVGDKENSHPNAKCTGAEQHPATPGQKRKRQELEVRLGADDAAETGAGSCYKNPSKTRCLSRRVDFQVRGDGRKSACLAHSRLECPLLLKQALHKHILDLAK